MIYKYIKNNFGINFCVKKTMLQFEIKLIKLFHVNIYVWILYVKPFDLYLFLQVLNMPGVYKIPDVGGKFYILFSITENGNVRNII